MSESLSDTAQRNFIPYQTTPVNHKPNIHNISQTINTDIRNIIQVINIISHHQSSQIYRSSYGPGLLICVLDP